LPIVAAAAAARHDKATEPADSWHTAALTRDRTMPRQQALDAITTATYAAKLAATAAIDATLPIDTAAILGTERTVPGREARPELVAPGKLGKRSMHTPEGRATLIHALAHIEMNAVDLALDILWRFPGMPDAFYRDWIRVAKEEAYHFSMLDAHLRGMGYAYGDFPAHHSLWEMAEKTRDDILARLALVPRTLEARGLDASPPIRDNRWYQHVCAERGLDPVAAYAEMAERYRAPKLRGPFNIEARRAAGFSEAELAALLA
jgi:uncharacterized ferritin-like protein (DUF455 family)